MLYNFHQVLNNATFVINNPGKKEVSFRQCFPFVPRGVATDQVGDRQPCAVSPGQRGCLSAVRWPAVHLCPCWSADGHVPLQVQADEADSHVQGHQASHLLQIQHSELQ